MACNYYLDCITLLQVKYFEKNHQAIKSFQETLFELFFSFFCFCFLVFMTRFMKSKGPGNSYQAASRLQNLSRIFLVSLQFFITDKLFCLKKNIPRVNYENFST